MASHGLRLACAPPPHNESAASVTTKTALSYSPSRRQPGQHRSDTMSLTNQTSARKCLPLPQPESFDYSRLAPELVADLRQHAARIRERTRITTATIIEIGKELLAAKQHLAHGQFKDWINAECGCTVRTAQNYLRAAKLAEAKGETVSLLPPRIVYQLTAKSTPPELTDPVLNLAATGTVITPAVMKAGLMEI